MKDLNNWSRFVKHLINWSGGVKYLNYWMRLILGLAHYNWGLHGVNWGNLLKRFHKQICRKNFEL